MEALVAALARLTATPGDKAVIDVLVPPLAEAEPSERDETVERAQRILSGRADMLVELGRALSGQSFPGCELMSTRVLVAALAVDPTVGDGVEALAGALTHLDRDDGEPLLDQALQLTGRGPQLLLVRAGWLRGDGRVAEAQQLVSEALEMVLALLAAAPKDIAVIDALVASLAQVERGEQDEAIERAQGVLSGHTDSLVALARALYGQSFPGCELLGASVLAAARETDPRLVI